MDQQDTTIIDYELIDFSRTAT